MPFPPDLKPLVRAVVLSSAVAAFALLFSACKSDPPGPGTPGISSPAVSSRTRAAMPMPPITGSSGNAANAQTFAFLDNSRARVTDYLGKVLILDFWATYCPPCLEETPHLQALHQQYNSQGLEIIGLNVGGPDDRDLIEGFKQRFNVTYPIGIPEPEMTGFYMQDDDRIPQTFVFDRHGKLLKRFTGFDERIKAEMEQLVQQAISE